MNRFNGIPFTPDESAVWQRTELSAATLYLPAGTSDQIISDLLIPRASDFGERISANSSSTVYCNGTFVLKEVAFDGIEDPVNWNNRAGLPTLQLSVALQHGLEKIGDRAQLPSGVRLRTPKYIGACVMAGAGASFRSLMTQEQGGRPQDLTDANLICSLDDRRGIYSTAYKAVGGNTLELVGYNDAPNNLLIGSDGELIKLNTANRFDEGGEQLPIHSLAS